MSKTNNISLDDDVSNNALNSLATNDKKMKIQMEKLMTSNKVMCTILSSDKWQKAISDNINIAKCYKTQQANTIIKILILITIFL